VTNPVRLAFTYEQDNLLFHCSLTAKHVLSDIIAHYQELLNCNYSFWFYSRLSLPAAVIVEWEFSHDSGRQRQTVCTHVTNFYTRQLTTYFLEIHCIS